LNKKPVYLVNLGMINALGDDTESIWKILTSGEPRGNALKTGYNGIVPYYHSAFNGLSRIPTQFDNRANRLLQTALEQISESVEKALNRWGAFRIGVIIGSTDNGSETSMAAIEYKRKHGYFPAGYNMDQQSPHSSSEFVKSHFNLKGPAMAISTACSSSALALKTAGELIRADICDAVIAGGTDVVSRAVYLGFGALEALSPELCNPFSINRKGITLGEGAAVFLVARSDLENKGLLLSGAGESADSHHMTAPDPAGAGAIKAMEQALHDADISKEDINYLNLHGTGTELNDAMESRAVNMVLGDTVPCSSTKPFTGHTLGAAGATEAGFCWLAMSSLNPEKILPPHLWDGKTDPELSTIALSGLGQQSESICYTMSNSFAFGGNNISLVLGREY